MKCNRGGYFGTDSVIRLYPERGGYINDWCFGESAIKDITDKMVQSGVDIVEIGFLKNEPYQKDRCVFNSVEQVKKSYWKEKGGSKICCHV